MRPTAVERLRHWWADIALASGLAFLAGLLRLVALGRPAERYFDEWFYASDACVYVENTSVCGYDAAVSKEHPPLGKWLISLGIEVFGFNPTAWRLVPALLGTLTVVLLYVLARRVGLGRAGSAAAGLLFGIDPMHVALSRIAMLDVFVTFFGLLAVLMALESYRAARPGTWYVATGMALGCAVACKWSGVFVAPLLVVVLVAGVRRRAPELTVVGAVRRAAPALVVALVLVPTTVYVVSFAGRLDGSVLSAPWHAGSWWRAFVRRQAFMLQFHSSLEGVFPFLSRPWSWFVLKRPVRMYFVDDGTRYRDILAVGNPVTWWTGLIAVAYSARRVVVDRRIDVHLLAVGGFLFLYVPWFVLGLSRSFTFAFYVLPVLPFVFLATGAVVDRAWRTIRGRAVVAVGAAAALAVAVFLAPVIYGVPLSYDAWVARMLFQDCGPLTPRDGAPQVRPTQKVEGPPPGWCWI